MIMNCKEGDLAIVVRSVMGNEGRIVRCIRLLTPGELVKTDTGQTVHVGRDPAWLIDAFLNKVLSSGALIKAQVAHDSFLKPIRDPDGEDETLAWAGKPAPVTVEDLSRRLGAMGMKLSAPMPVKRGRKA